MVGEYKLWSTNQVLCMHDQDHVALALRRVFGDFCLKDYGLICFPSVNHKHTNEDEFVVLATGQELDYTLFE